MSHRTRPTTLFALALPLLLAGCGGTHDREHADATPKAPARPAKSEGEVEADIEKSLALLKPEDRKLAEAQRFCVFEEENRLGSMGPPVKVMIQGKPVFFCCGSCKKKSGGKDEKLLAKAEELKKKYAPAEKTP
jgi:hypothetical protein